MVEDSQRYWSAGKAYYDPSNITVPTLLILAEWDADTPPYMAQAVFAKLTNTPRKRLVMIGEGTHGVALERRIACSSSARCNCSSKSRAKAENAVDPFATWP